MPRSVARGSSSQVEYWESHSLEDHVALIKRQVDRSLNDPTTRQLALKIVNGVYDTTVNGVPVVEAWGKAHPNPSASAALQGHAKCAADDPVCESIAIWNFTVANVKYVPDPDGYDLFATVRYTLEAEGGDCDDMVITMAALHKAVGFRNVVARVVSVGGRQWEHVYLLVGFPKTGKVQQWVPLDPTVKHALPGWEYNGVSHTKDFKL